MLSHRTLEINETFSFRVMMRVETLILRLSVLFCILCTRCTLYIFLITELVLPKCPIRCMVVFDTSSSESNTFVRFIINYNKKLISYITVTGTEEISGRRFKLPCGFTLNHMCFCINIKEPSVSNTTRVYIVTDGNAVSLSIFLC